jgi:hypothetical protein
MNLAVRHETSHHYDASHLNILKHNGKDVCKGMG